MGKRKYIDLGAKGVDITAEVLETENTRLKRLLRTAMELLERVQGTMHTVNSPHYILWSREREELRKVVKELLGDDYPW